MLLCSHRFYKCALHLYCIVRLRQCERTFFEFRTLHVLLDNHSNNVFCCHTKCLKGRTQSLTTQKDKYKSMPRAGQFTSTTLDKIIHSVGTTEINVNRSYEDKSRLWFLKCKTQQMQFDYAEST